MTDILPIGKLSTSFLNDLLSYLNTPDPQVIVGPGIGLDCAVISLGNRLLVFKSDPITFATDNIGWYAVQVNVNDIVTTGALPRWFLATLLLPERYTTAELIERINHQLLAACQQIGMTVIGGHTEITAGLDRPIIAGTIIGEVAPGSLITPQGARPDDRILLTKGVPIEATAIVAREFPQRLAASLTSAELEQARHFLTDPGISIYREARLASATGHVTAMHDPTEGGLAAALWELATASQNSLVVDLARTPIPPLSAKICHALDLNPLAAIASGALLMTTSTATAPQVRQTLEQAGIRCVEIGRVEAGPIGVWHETPSGRRMLSRPDRDEITKLFEI